MPAPIVLKDASSVDQTFSFVGHGSNNSLTYERQIGALVGRAKLTLSINGNTNVNRVKVKLSVPTVSAVTPTTGAAQRPVIEYTHVASADISVVAFSSPEARADIIAMFDSLLSNSDIQSMVKDAALPFA